MNQQTAPSDGYVQIPASLLNTLELHHVVSEVDQTIGLPDNIPPDALTGFTEWAGLWNEKQVTLGWDWGVVQDAIIVLNPAEIRGNVAMVLDSGERASPLKSRIRIFEYLETLPWREIAIKPLLRARH